MSSSEPSELELIASWYIGERPYDDEVQACMSRLDKSDDAAGLALGTEIGKAGRRYRREHGAWPTYREWPE